MTIKITRKLPYPKISGQKSDITRTIPSFWDLKEVRQSILQCFEESPVILSNAILNHLAGKFPRSTIYDNLKSMVRDEILGRTAVARRNLYALMLKGKEIVRTKQTGTTFHYRNRLECLRFSYRLLGPDFALEKLQQDISNHHLGKCSTNDKLNWLQQIVTAQFSDLMGLTLQFHWGAEPKAILNLPAIWGKDLVEIIERLWRRLGFVTNRLAAEIFRWGIVLDDPVQVQDFELEFPFYNMNQLSPKARMKMVERESYDGKKFNTAVKKRWFDYSKKHKEAGISLGDLSDLEKAAMFLKAPELIADLKLRQDSLENENKLLKESLTEMKEMLQLVLNQQPFQGGLKERKKGMI